MSYNNGGGFNNRSMNNFNNNNNNGGNNNNSRPGGLAPGPQRPTNPFVPASGPQRPSSFAPSGPPGGVPPPPGFNNNNNNNNFGPGGPFGNNNGPNGFNGPPPQPGGPGFNQFNGPPGGFGNGPQNPGFNPGFNNNGNNNSGNNNNAPNNFMGPPGGPNFNNGPPNGFGPGNNNSNNFNGPNGGNGMMMNGNNNNNMPFGGGPQGNGPPPPPPGGPGMPPPPPPPGVGGMGGMPPMQQNNGPLGSSMPGGLPPPPMPPSALPPRPNVAPPMPPNNGPIMPNGLPPMPPNNNAPPMPNGVPPMPNGIPPIPPNNNNIPPMPPNNNNIPPMPTGIPPMPGANNNINTNINAVNNNSSTNNNSNNLSGVPPIPPMPKTTIPPIPPPAAVVGVMPPTGIPPPPPTAAAVLPTSIPPMPSAPLIIPPMPTAAASAMRNVSAIPLLPPSTADHIDTDKIQKLKQQKEQEEKQRQLQKQKEHEERQRKLEEEKAKQLAKKREEEKNQREQQQTTQKTQKQLQEEERKQKLEQLKLAKLQKLGGGAAAAAAAGTNAAAGAQSSTSTTTSSNNNNNNNTISTTISNAASANASTTVLPPAKDPGERFSHLSTTEREKLFLSILKSSQVTTNTNWSQLLPTLVVHPDYHAVPSIRRRELFEMYQQFCYNNIGKPYDIAGHLSEEDKKAQHEKHLYSLLLSDDIFTPNTAQSGCVANLDDNNVVEQHVTYVYQSAQDKVVIAGNLGDSNDVSTYLTTVTSKNWWVDQIMANSTQHEDWYGIKQPNNCKLCKIVQFLERQYQVTLYNQQQIDEQQKKNAANNAATSGGDDSTTKPTGNNPDMTESARAFMELQKNFIYDVDCKYTNPHVIQTTIPNEIRCPYHNDKDNNNAVLSKFLLTQNNLINQKQQGSFQYRPITLSVQPKRPTIFTSTFYQHRYHQIVQQYINSILLPIMIRILIALCGTGSGICITEHDLVLFNALRYKENYRSLPPSIDFWQKWELEEKKLKEQNDGSNIAAARRKAQFQTDTYSKRYLIRTALCPENKKTHQREPYCISIRPKDFTLNSGSGNADSSSSGSSSSTAGSSAAPQRIHNHVHNNSQYPQHDNIIIYNTQTSQDMQKQSIAARSSQNATNTPYSNIVNKQVLYNPLAPAYQYGVMNEDDYQLFLSSTCPTNDPFYHINNNNNKTSNINRKNQYYALSPPQSVYSGTQTFNLEIVEEVNAQYNQLLSKNPVQFNTVTTLIRLQNHYKKVYQYERHLGTKSSKYQKYLEETNNNKTNNNNHDDSTMQDGVPEPPSINGPDTNATSSSPNSDITTQPDILSMLDDLQWNAKTYKDYFYKKFVLGSTTNNNNKQNEKHINPAFNYLTCSLCNTCQCCCSCDIKQFKNTGIVHQTQQQQEDNNNIELFLPALIPHYLLSTQHIDRADHTLSLFPVNRPQTMVSTTNLTNRNYLYKVSALLYQHPLLQQIAAALCPNYSYDPTMHALSNDQKDKDGKDGNSNNNDANNNTNLIMNTLNALQDVKFGNKNPFLIDPMTTGQRLLSQALQYVIPLVGYKLALYINTFTNIRTTISTLLAQGLEGQVSATFTRLVNRYQQLQFRTLQDVLIDKTYILKQQQKEKEEIENNKKSLLQQSGGSANTTTSTSNTASGKKASFSMGYDDYGFEDDDDDTMADIASSQVVATQDGDNNETTGSGENIMNDHIGDITVGTGISNNTNNNIIDDKSTTTIVTSSTLNMTSLVPTHGNAVTGVLKMSFGHQLISLFIESIVAQAVNQSFGKATAISSQMLGLEGFTQLIPTLPSSSSSPSSGSSAFINPDQNNNKMTITPEQHSVLRTKLSAMARGENTTITDENVNQIWSILQNFNINNTNNNNNLQTTTTTSSINQQQQQQPIGATGHCGYLFHALPLSRVTQALPTAAQLIQQQQDAILLQNGGSIQQQQNSSQNGNNNNLGTPNNTNTTVNTSLVFSQPQWLSLVLADRTIPQPTTAQQRLAQVLQDLIPDPTTTTSLNIDNNPESNEQQEQQKQNISQKLTLLAQQLQEQAQYNKLAQDLMTLSPILPSSYVLFPPKLDNNNNAEDNGNNKPFQYIHFPKCCNAANNNNWSYNYGEIHQCTCLNDICNAGAVQNNNNNNNNNTIVSSTNNNITTSTAMPYFICLLQFVMSFSAFTYPHYVHHLDTIIYEQLQQQTTERANYATTTNALQQIPISLDVLTSTSNSHIEQHNTSQQHQAPVAIVQPPDLPLTTHGLPLIDQNNVYVDDKLTTTYPYYFAKPLYGMTDMNNTNNNTLLQHSTNNTTIPQPPITLHPMSLLSPIQPVHPPGDPRRPGDMSANTGINLLLKPLVFKPIQNMTTLILDKILDKLMDHVNSLFNAVRGSYDVVYRGIMANIQQQAGEVEKALVTTTEQQANPTTTNNTDANTESTSTEQTAAQQQQSAAMAMNTSLVNQFNVLEKATSGTQYNFLITFQTIYNQIMQGIQRLGTVVDKHFAAYPTAASAPPIDLVQLEKDLTALHTQQQVEPKPSTDDATTTNEQVDHQPQQQEEGKDQQQEQEKIIEREPSLLLSPTDLIALYKVIQNLDTQYSTLYTQFALENPQAAAAAQQQKHDEKKMQLLLTTAGANNALNNILQHNPNIPLTLLSEQEQQQQVDPAVASSTSTTASTTDKDKKSFLSFTQCPAFITLTITTNLYIYHCTRQDAALLRMIDANILRPAPALGKFLANCQQNITTQYIISRIRTAVKQHQQFQADLTSSPTMFLTIDDILSFEQYLKLLGTNQPLLPPCNNHVNTTTNADGKQGACQHNNPTTCIQAYARLNRTQQYSMIIYQILSRSVATLTASNTTTSAKW